MNNYALAVQQREATRATRKQRSNTILFGVVYGPGFGPTPIEVDLQTAKKVFTDAGTSRIIQLTIDDKTKADVLLKDTDFDPVSNELRHFDLYAVKKGEKIDVEIPIVLVGDAPAARLGHVVRQHLDSIELRTIPSSIPESIVFDVTKLTDVGDSLSLSDITLPDGVELIDEDLLDQVVVRIDAIEELVVEDASADASVENVASEQGAAPEADATDTAKS